MRNCCTIAWLEMEVCSIAPTWSKQPGRQPLQFWRLGRTIRQPLFPTMRRVAGDRRLRRPSPRGGDIVGGLQRLSELSLGADCAAKMAPSRASRRPLSRAEGLVRNDLMLVLGF